jgi:hypothetical protein
VKVVFALPTDVEPVIEEFVDHPGTRMNLPFSDLEIAPLDAVVPPATIPLEPAEEAKGKATLKLGATLRLLLKVHIHLIQWLWRYCLKQSLRYF